MGLDRQQACSATRVRQSVLDLKVAALIASLETLILKMLRGKQFARDWRIVDASFEQASFQVDRVAINA